MRVVLAALLLQPFAAPSALAGPPYATDDPEPTDPGHWEIYAFTSGTRVTGLVDGQTGLDLNYGAVPGVQLTATLPLAFATGQGAGTGDLEFGVKYRFLHKEAAGVSFALFPRLIAPTANHRFGTGRAQFLLPLWGQKDMGHWSLFGGGGYMLNPGRGNRDFWTGGVALTREIGSRLSLGGEVTREGPGAVGDHATTNLGLGGSYRLRGPFALLFSAGPGFSQGTGTQFHAYAALALNF